MDDGKTGGDSKPNLVQVKHKLWLEKNGGIFGEGLFQLLSNVAGLGSISHAAREMGMSYRAAWGKIKMAEDGFGVPLVITHVGGEMGGGARLTPAADELLIKYRRFQELVDTFVQNSFQETFRGWPGP
ncbi:MAG TPA: LysR family transcriptional regulator [Spirochaetia bacterium]|nr:LysR family transcriptional regulator [Spirochaetia bacterium]